MKNLFLSAGIIAASAFALASCSQELAPATPDQGKPVTYTLNVATPETKTTVDNSWNVAWAEGDAITAVVNSTAATFNYANGNSFTTTGAISLGESNNWYLLYPSSKYFTSVNSDGYAFGTTSKSYFNIPNKTNTQSTIGDKSHLGGQLLYGVGTSTGSEQASVQMNHLVSVIRVKVTNNTSDAIDIAKVNVANDADARMSGTFYVNFTDGTTEGSVDEKGAEYSYPYAELSVSNGTIAKGSTGELYVPVNPFSLTSGDKVTIVLTLRDGAVATYEAAVSSNVEFTAGHIKTRSITVKDSDIVTEKFVEFAHTQFDGQGVSGTGGAVSATSGSITISANKAFGHAENLRIYKGDDSKLTISISSGTITKVEINCITKNDTKYGPGCFEEQTGYSYIDKVGTWTGASTSVSLTAKKNQVRATSIKVYYE